MRRNVGSKQPICSATRSIEIDRAPAHLSDFSGVLGQRERGAVGLRGPGPLQLLQSRLPGPLPARLKPDSLALQVSPRRFSKLGGTR